MQSFLRREVESPTKAESSREANLGLRLENRRIPGGNNRKLVDTSSLRTTETRSSSSELSRELRRVLVEVSTRGFLLPTIGTMQLCNKLIGHTYYLFICRQRRERELRVWDWMTLRNVRAHIDASVSVSWT